MTTDTRETRIESDPSVPIIRIVRDFDAPPEQVFRAWIEPELVVQWLGPRDLVMTIDHWEGRTGGSYRYLHSRGDDTFGFHGCFHEVRPSERIVQTFTFEGAPDGVSLDTLVLEDLGDGRTRTVVSSLVESFEIRDMILASGMERGVREGYERLDEMFAR